MLEQTWSCVCCIRSRSACAKNLVGGAENSLRRTLVDAVALIPMLDVTSAELRPWQSKRFTTKQRDGLGLYFAEFTRYVLEVGMVLLSAMPKDNVGQFVE